MKQPQRLALHPLLRSGAVLQRERPLRIAGWCPPGSGVRVELVRLDSRGQRFAEHTRAAADGSWAVWLRAQPAGGEWRLTVEAGMLRTVLVDLRIGDVYLCGGQSNMEHPYALSTRAAEDGGRFNDPELRFLRVPLRHVLSPDLAPWDWTTSPWQTLERPAMDDFSALAAYAGLTLRRLDPDVPIGLVGCYQGATSASCWLSRASFERHPDFAVYQAEFEERRAPWRDPSVYQAAAVDYERRAAARHERVMAYRARHPGATEAEIDRALGPGPWPPPENEDSFLRPCGLYETMLAPLAGAGFAAALWYQGESDAGHAGLYPALLEAMIADWRALFGELPLLQVQLPAWHPDPAAADDRSWGRLRAAQRLASARIPDTGHIVALDQGQLENLHPPNKDELGRRLALHLLDRAADAYIAAAKWLQNGMVLELTGEVFWDAKQDQDAGDSGFDIRTGDGWRTLPRSAVTVGRRSIRVAWEEAGVEELCYGGRNASPATLLTPGGGALEAAGFLRADGGER
ncbi:MAG: sialate O-acetylesterase [Bacillota bacterium]|nr:sialate O-acetylesterase [Bacillota bacterium]